MAQEHGDSQFSWGWGLGLGAVVGALISAIVGMLRLSKPKERAVAPEATATPEQAVIPGFNTAPSVTNSDPATKQEIPAPQTISPPPGSTQWSRGTKYFVAALLFLAFLGILYISSGSLSTIIFAALLTFIVNPIIKFFQRRLHMKRGGATVLAYLLVLALILVLPFMIIPSIVEAVQFIANLDFAEMSQNLADWISIQAQNVAIIPFVGNSLASSLEQLALTLSGLGTGTQQPTDTIDISMQNLGGRIAQTLGFLGRVFGPVFSIVTAVVFTILISLHMSLSVDMLRSGVKKLIPPAYEVEIGHLLQQLILIWKSFLRGQISLMVIMGLIVWLGNAILGTPQALLLGLLAGLLEVIPSLGPILATIPAVMLALFLGSQTSLLGLHNLEHWAFALLVIAFYVIVQMIENQLLVPYVLGDAVDLPPLVVIIGVVIGGSAFGLLGVFLATPVISSSREIFMYLYDKILEPPPEPEPEEEKPSLMDTIRTYAARLPRPQWRRKSASEPEAVMVTDEQTVETPL
jgi:predicted PurR-regulated permease PerM